MSCNPQEKKVWLPHDLAEYRAIWEPDLHQYWDVLFARDWKEHEFYAWVALAEKDEVIRWAQDKDGGSDQDRV